MVLPAIMHMQQKQGFYASFVFIVYFFLMQTLVCLWNAKRQKSQRTMCSDVFSKKKQTLMNF